MLNLKFPEVRRFYRAAVVHLDAARILFEHCPSRAPSTRGHEVVYLSGYVVECSFKALLLSRFPLSRHASVVAWFKTDVKHNLERLKMELFQKSVSLPKNLSEHLKRISANWSSAMRYDVRAWKKETVERVLESTQGLFEWVQGG